MVKIKNPVFRTGGYTNKLYNYLVVSGTGVAG
jgi:hypothetical protein